MSRMQWENIFVVAFNKLTFFFSVLEIIFDATEQAGVRALVSVGWVCHDTLVVYRFRRTHVKY